MDCLSAFTYYHFCKALPIAQQKLSEKSFPFFPRCFFSNAEGVEANLKNKLII